MSGSRKPAIEARPELVEAIRTLAGRGFTDAEIAAEVQLGKPWIAEVRRAHRIPVVPASRWGTRARPKPAPVEELQRSWDRAIEEHRAYPPAGICPSCHAPRPLRRDGLLRPHMRQGQPCRSTRPLPSYAAEEMAA